MKKRWIAILCMVLALVTLTSCSSCDPAGSSNGTTDTTKRQTVNTFGDPDNSYFYVWRKGLTEDLQYYQFAIKANSKVGESETVYASEFTLRAPDGTIYNAAGLVSGYSVDNTTGVTVYELTDSRSYTYNERSLIIVVFTEHPEGSTFLYKGAEVEDRSSLSEDEDNKQEQTTTPEGWHEPVFPEPDGSEGGEG